MCSCFEALDPVIGLERILDRTVPEPQMDLPYSEKPRPVCRQSFADLYLGSHEEGGVPPGKAGGLELCAELDAGSSSNQRSADKSIAALPLDPSTGS